LYNILIIFGLNNSFLLNNSNNNFVIFIVTASIFCRLIINHCQILTIDAAKKIGLTTAQKLTSYSPMQTPYCRRY